MKLFPKGTPHNPVSGALTPGVVVMYEQEGQPLLAVVLADKGKKFSLLNERNREIELPPDRLYQIPIKPLISSTSAEKIAYLSKLRAEGEAASTKIQIEDLWDVAKDAEREYSTGELSDLYFSGASNPVQFGQSQLGLRLALIADKVYFKRHKDSFTPRPRDVVENLKIAEVHRKERERIKLLTRDAFKRLVKGELQELPVECREMVSLLEDFAAEAVTIDEPKSREAKQLIMELINDLGLNIPGSAHEKTFLFLSKIGHFERLTNIPLIRHKPPIAFSEETLEQSAKIKPVIDNARVDLTHLECITIDDATTKDMDDALSVEITPDGYTLGVHISDVASHIPVDSKLDCEAASRATSVYLSDITINMLPDSLAGNTCSLVQGEKRAAISVIAKLSRNFEVRSTQIVPSVIKVRSRLTYEEAENLLEHQDEQLGLLYEISTALDANRLQSGGSRVHKQEGIVVINPDKTLSLSVIDEGAPARHLVSELMVFANNIIAEFAAQKQIPIIYRRQERPDAQQEPVEPLGGAAQEYALRSKLKKSTMSLEPGLHATLGLNAYTQATSPIRRYLDLCVQRQLLSFFAQGVPLYSKEEIIEIMNCVGEPLARAQSLTKEGKRFWLLMYIKENILPTGTIEGTVLRTDMKQPLVELDIVHMTTLTAVAKGTKPGARITFRIKEVNPYFNVLRLEPLNVARV